MARRQCGNLFGQAIEQWIRADGEF
jgi:hypothetical protein